MRKWIAAAVFALGFAMGAMAQDEDIEGVISSQLEAFKSDDFEEAFEFAHPSIRNLFRTPENFGIMVRRGYPMVWRPAEVMFLDLRDEAGILTQRVQIVDGAGATHILDYSMIETSDGWKISGVQIIEAPGVSA